MPKALASDRDFARLLDDYDCFLFDCDGVIWNGSTGNDLHVLRFQLFRTDY